MAENIRLDVDIPAKMRDGVTLYADVYRPDKPGPYPVLLSRTPYDKTVAPLWAFYINIIRAAQSGYAVVIQDCRGTGKSEGDFYPFMNEFNDGYDSVEWVASQPWSTGKVGMFAPSYLGITQWAAAVMQPPHLTAIFPGEVGNDPHGSLHYPGGAFALDFSLMFTAGVMGMMQLMRNPLQPDLMLKIGRLAGASAEWDKHVGFVPLKQYPLLKEVGVCDYYYDWLNKRDEKEYWEKVEWAKFDKVTVPAYTQTGWYDLWQRGALGAFTGMKAKGGSELASKNQRLLVGPWVHGPLLSNEIGHLDTGLASNAAVIDFTGIQLRWFDYWLKGIDNGIMQEPPVRIFVMGDNVWRFENEWPLARTQYTNYYFHSNGNANTLFGDGTLSSQEPAAEDNDCFVYNPKNPVPTKGGNVIAKSGAFDQSEIERRADVLVYTTPPLEKDLEVTGPVEVKLFAASSARDTDFTAKLVDVYPDGKAYNITDGIIRARYRDQSHPMTPSLLMPNTVYEYTIDLWATSNVFKKGHCIRLEISSSNFPRFDRNPNTGNNFGEDAELKIATQTIFHDNARPSRIVLPVIPR